MCELKLVRAVRLVIQQEPVRFGFVGTDIEVGYVTMVRSIAKKIVLYQKKVVLLWTFIDRSITFKNFTINDCSAEEETRTFIDLGIRKVSHDEIRRTRENRKDGGKKKKGAEGRR